MLKIDVETIFHRYLDRTNQTQVNGGLRVLKVDEETLSCSGETDLIAWLSERDGSWDVVIIDSALDRFCEISDKSALLQLGAWLQAHARAFLAPCPRNFFNWSVNELGPFTTHHLWDGFEFITEFAGELPGERPLLLGSHEKILISDRTIPASELTRMFNSDEFPDAPWDKPSPVHTYQVGSDEILKWELSNHEYLSPSQVLHEARFLTHASDQEKTTLRLPQVKAIDVGQFRVAMIRSLVPGKPPQSINSVIDLCIAYSAQGLFHNDLRPWNVLQTEDEHGNEIAAFIDFGMVSRADNDVQNIPQILALIGTLIHIDEVDKSVQRIRAGDFFATDLERFACETLKIDDPYAEFFYEGPWKSLGERFGSSAGIPLTDVDETVRVILGGFADV